MFETIRETVETYDNMLNECHEWPTIAGMQFAPADILREVDPITYKCGWLDWCDDEGIDTDELEDDYTFNRDRM